MFRPNKSIILKLRILEMKYIYLMIYVLPINLSICALPKFIYFYVHFFVLFDYYHTNTKIPFYPCDQKK